MLLWLSRPKSSVISSQASSMLPVACSAVISPARKAGQLAVQNHAGVLLRAGDLEVGRHVRMVQAVLDGAEVVLGELGAEPGLDPVPGVLELRVPVGIVARPADGHVDVRLRGLVHVGQEVVGGLLDRCVGVLVDRAGPSAERGERRVVDAVGRVRAERRVALLELAGLRVQRLGRARHDHGAHLVPDRGAGLVDRQRADVAPVDREPAPARLDQRAGVADVVVQLVRRAELAGRLVDPESLLPRLVVDLGLHRVVVEEDSLSRALGLHESGGDGAHGEIRLRVPLLEDAGSEVGLAVPVQVLAVHRAGDLHVLVPGARRRKAHVVQDVPAVVEHLEVAVDGDQVGLAADLLVVLAEVGRDVVDVDLVVVRDVAVQRLHQARVDQFGRPAGREHAHVDRVRAGRPVGEDLLEQLRERNLVDADLRAGHRGELLAAFDEALRDDGTRTGQDLDGHAAVVLGGCGRR